MSPWLRRVSVDRCVITLTYSQGDHLNSLQRHMASRRLYLSPVLSRIHIVRQNKLIFMSDIGETYLPYTPAFSAHFILRRSAEITLAELISTSC